ncbi:circularly permuted type 2 ATP-grasp protein [Corynebacterium pacaense]|uniref:circularly permuted type 2 ATP-grasp protein n=1 Tax=Corynebacterium pacaense TaxID=1816684 RepID=UPI0009B9DD3B|nr:circularly permuted type 2 ATP-grasp protein [Corynebacterium pacaense]
MTIANTQYQVNDLVFDEMMGRDGIRPIYRELFDVYHGLATEDLESRVAYLNARYLDTGVTFDFSGQEEAFPLDIVPRLISAAEFAQTELGLKQRVRALEAFLADVYGSGQLFNDGVIPRAVVTTSAHFIRAVAGYTPPNGVRIHVAGIDLIRDDAGGLRVLEDNARIPSGVSYVLTNRQATAAALPEAVARYNVARVDDYPARLRTALAKAAPSGIADPTIVVLTPGVHNSAYFEHAMLARTMGVPLVEGRDLVVRHGVAYLRETTGLTQVHVIYRRVDDEYIDPVKFRPDSLLGCAGLISAQANGNLTIANAVGNGVADDKLVYSYVPDLIRYYLGEEPLIPNVDTWRLEDPVHREEVLDRIDELVVKPVDGSGGKGILIGPSCSRAELDAARERIIADPRGWIAQPLIQLSTVPTMTDSGLEPRHVDLRPFIVNDGDDMWIAPGGLTRVALEKGQMIVNSSQGGGSKDTWVISPGSGGPDSETGRSVPVPNPDAQALERLGTSILDVRSEEYLEQQQQQQQQQSVTEESPSC